METKNYRVNYQINGNHYHSDFSMSGTITNETKNISAWNKIKQSHPNVKREDVSNIRIDDLKVW